MLSRQYYQDTACRCPLIKSEKIMISDKIDWTDVDKEPVKTVKQTDWCLPAGEYCAEIIGVDMHQAQDERFIFMETKFQVLNGDFKGRIFFIKFYFHHRDFPNLVIKTKQKLRELGIACLGKAPAHGGELTGCKCFVTLSVREGGPKKDGTGNYPNSNLIESCRSLSGPASAVVNVPEKQKVVAEFNDEIPW